MRAVTIAKPEEGIRLDRYLQRVMPLAPKSFFYRMLRAKNITVNRRRCSGNEALAEGDTVYFFLSDETMEKSIELTRKKD